MHPQWPLWPKSNICEVLISVESHMCSLSQISHKKNAYTFPTVGFLQPFLSVNLGTLPVVFL